MIRYALECPQEHVFEQWFDSMEAYDTQAAAGALTCPTCGSTEIRKSLMAPSIGVAKSQAAMPSCAGPSCATGMCPAMAG